MEDILFDLISREIVFTGSGTNSDFSLRQNPSVQNGGNIMYSRCANIENPIVGIGVDQFINSNTTNAARELSRWQQQVINDGGKGAYISTPGSNGLDFTLEVDYIG